MAEKENRACRSCGNPDCAEEWVVLPETEERICLDCWAMVCSVLFRLGLLWTSSDATVLVSRVGA